MSCKNIIFMTVLFVILPAWIGIIWLEVLKIKGGWQRFLHGWVLGFATMLSIAQVVLTHPDGSASGMANLPDSAVSGYFLSAAGETSETFCRNGDAGDQSRNRKNNGRANERGIFEKSVWHRKTLDMDIRRAGGGVTAAAGVYSGTVRA